jgi:hypothetical protein
MRDERVILTGRVIMRHIVPLWCIALGLMLLGPAKVGFLCDDFELISEAADVSAVKTVEPHHWAPLMMCLYKATAMGSIGRGAWLAIAYGAHLLNIAMLFMLLSRLRFSLFETWLVTVLFATCPAGFEALAWSAAVGYVLTVSLILAGLLVLLPLDRQHSRWSVIALGLLQAAAALVWDWGILFAPIMALCFAVTVTDMKCLAAVVRRCVSVLWAALACWLLVVVLRAALAQRVGYGVSFDPLRSGYFLLTAALRCMYPNGSRAFFRSPVGLSVSVSLVLVLLWLSRSHCRIRGASAIFVLCQVPYVLFSSIQSRYFYVGCAFLYAAIAALVSLIPRRSIRLVVFAGLVLSAGLWAGQRALLWRDAYAEAQRLKAGIEAYARKASAPLVVVNLPYEYGPEGWMWMVPLWRNGMSAFKGEIIRVNTPGAPFTWGVPDIPVMLPEDVRRKFSGHSIVEVRYAQPHDWKRFAIQELSAVAH